MPATIAGSLLLAHFSVVVLLAVKPAAAEVDQAVLKAEEDRVAVMARAKDPVLAIFSPDGGGGGSGVVISADGYALTNFHVARPSGDWMKCGMADGQIYDAVIVGMDPTGDVALIRLFGRDDFPCAPMADSDQVRTGDWVFAMGNPFLLAADFQPTVTYGIISGVHRYQPPAGTILEYADCLQTDASINPGNSGGPLFDAAGRLIGINGRGSFEKRGRVNVGAGYAISINQIKNFLGHLKGGRIVDHASLGAQVALDDEGRVVVTDILEDCDAYRRGLRYDDEIISFGGRMIRTPNGFKNVLGIFPKGWRVPLSFRHEGKRHDVLVRLAGVHSEAELLRKAMGREGPMPMPMPEPKPDGQPKEKSGERPIPLPEPDHEEPVHPGQRQEPMPQIVSKHFDQKRGYANYYFNRLNRDRVWKAWDATGRFAAIRGAWTLAGPLAGGGEYQFRIGDDGASLGLPSGQVRWSTGQRLSESLIPAGSGGLLPALHLWRRLATEGPEKFGEVYYLGAAPLAGHDGLAEVLVAIHGPAESRFYFDAAKGQLLALEMFPEENADPCEVYFSEYQEVDGRQAPKQIEVRFGDVQYAVFQIGRVEMEKGAQP